MRPVLDRSRFKSKTEVQYNSRLEILKRAGSIIDYVYEGLKFRLGEGAVYTPDFLVVHEDHFELHEVKGHWREAARVRIKVAAEKFPWFTFVAVQYKSGAWIEERF